MSNILLKVLKPHKDAIHKRRPNEDFDCPKCGAQYKLVRMPAPIDLLIHRFIARFVTRNWRRLMEKIS
jgi:hypothetical protein